MIFETDRWNSKQQKIKVPTTILSRSSIAERKIQSEDFSEGNVESKSRMNIKYRCLAQKRVIGKGLVWA